MNIDLLHNKIIKDTITDRFVNEILTNLAPQLEELYGDELIGIQMYEDYIADNFIFEGEVYYPLTLVFDNSVLRKWVKWRRTNKLKIPSSPYSYNGTEPIKFTLCDTVPSEFENKLLGRSMYFESGVVPLNIQSSSNDKTFLSGKYSQTFIDELARQISAEIQKAFNLEGLAQSTLSMVMAFSPETYMEHVVDNVTYRRLLLGAKGCSLRDFWIKWTRVDSAVSYTVSDNVVSSQIIFEIAEDVPQKIREKEYRFLSRTSITKYQNAMGRKNITEWRDLIKRIIKRGEVTVFEVPETESIFDDINAKLAAALGTTVDSVISEEPIVQNDDINELLKASLMIEDEPEEILEEVEEIEEAEEAEEAEEVEEIEEIEEPTEETDTATADEEDPTADDYEEENRLREEEIRREIEAKLRAEYEEKLKENELLIKENMRLETLAKAKEQERLHKEEIERQEKEKLRQEIEQMERAERLEKERLAEAAKRSLAEEQRKQAEREAEEARRLAEEERIAEEKRRAEEEARRAAEIAAEQKRIKAEMMARQAAEEKANAPKVQASGPNYTYTSKCVKLIFRRPVDQNITKRIHEIILTTIKYNHKENVYMKIKATVPDTNTVKLDFLKVPEQETELLVDIIKVLGKSNLGIVKATLE